MSRPEFDTPVVRPSQFWLIWHRDETHREYIAHAVQPINISRGGIVLYLVGTPPPKEQRVWVSLGPEVPDMSLFLAAEVFEIKPDTRNEAELHLAFFDLCPEEFYRVATRTLARDTSVSI